MYNKLIIDNFSDPKYIGELEAPDLEYEIGNPVCGDRIRIHIEMDGEKISKSMFRAWGCATSVATANIFCSSITGASFAAIGARGNSEIEKMLGELEPSQHHCVKILHELHQNLTNYLTSEVVA